MPHRKKLSPEVSVAVLLDTTVLEDAKKLIPTHDGKKIYVLDALHYMLQPKEFHSIIISNASQLIEFGRSYINPDTNQEVLLNHRGNLPGIQHVRQQLSGYKQTHGPDALAKQLAGPAPEADTKWVVHTSEYSQTRNDQLHERHEYAKHVGDSPAKLTQKLVRSKHINGGIGEKDIRSIIEKTEFHHPVYIISDDLRAFYDKERSPHYVEHLRTKDKQNVHFSTLENLVNSFLSVPGNAARMEKDLGITADALVESCTRDAERSHQHEVISNKKWVYPQMESMESIFALAHKRETTERDEHYTGLLPNQFAQRIEKFSRNSSGLKR